MNHDLTQLFSLPDIECPLRNRLQVLTGLRFAFASANSIEDLNVDNPYGSQYTEFDQDVELRNVFQESLRTPGKAHFLESEDSWTVCVSFDRKRVLYHEAVEMTAETWGYLQRLVHVSVEQIHKDNQLEQQEADADLFAEHLSVLYEQVHAVAQLSHVLNLTIPLDDIIPIFERALAESMHVKAVFYFELSNDELKIQSSTIAQRISPEVITYIRQQLCVETKDVVFLTLPNQEDILCTRVSSSDPYPWLVVIPHIENRLGSEEAQFLRTVSRMLEAHLNNRSLFVEKDLMQISFVKSLVSTLDARDHYTQGHSTRVAELAADIAHRMRLTNDEVDAIYTSGLLHDIGKIGISDEVLRKEDKLSDADWAEIKRHPVIGYEILANVPQFASILPGVKHHHERVDGKGYPDGLSGLQLGTMPRILAVADAFDAMSSDRPYRQGMPAEKVDRILAEGAGTQWDAATVELFLKHKHELRASWRASFEQTSQT